MSEVVENEHKSEEINKIDAATMMKTHIDRFIHRCIHVQCIAVYMLGCLPLLAGFCPLVKIRLKSI